MLKNKDKPLEQILYLVQLEVVTMKI